MSFFTKMSSFVRKAPPAESVEKKEEVKPTSIKQEVEKVATEAPKGKAPDSETPSEISSSASSPSRSSSVESSESSSEMADIAAEKKETAAAAVVAPVVGTEGRQGVSTKIAEEKAVVPAEEQEKKSSMDAEASPVANPTESDGKLAEKADTAGQTPTKTAEEPQPPAEKPAALEVKTSDVAAEKVPEIAPVTSAEEKQPVEGSPVKAPESAQAEPNEDVSAAAGVSPKHESAAPATDEKPVAETPKPPSASEEPAREATVPATAPESTEEKPTSPAADVVEVEVAKTAPSASSPPAQKAAAVPSDQTAESPAKGVVDPLAQDAAEAPVPVDGAKTSEKQVDVVSSEKVPAERVEAEMKPSADDSGIQEPDAKHVEGGSGDESQEGEKVASDVQVPAAENVSEGGAAVRPADEEEEWSDEDEGHASYGDEQEASLPKKSETVSDEDANLDFDEDKSNPQYIPKKGAFYEHDDRRGTDDEDETAEEEANKDKEAEESEVAGGSKDSPEHRRTQRVLQSETKDRWDHDMFDPNEQGPKTSDELVQQYGYDIRDESSAPRAARRRRYGRGPNKYTRDWQDEKAYHGKTHNAQERREKEFHPRKDDFPCLPSAQRPREPQNLKESKDHQVREERQEHPRDNRRQSDRGERPERNDRTESKDPRRSDQGRDNIRKDRRDLRNKLDANRHDNQRFDGRKPARNEGWGGADNGGHRDHGPRDNGGGRPRGNGDHRDNFRDNGHRENFHRENSHRENWRDNRDLYRDNREGGRPDNRDSGRDARDAGRSDARDGGRDNREGGREIIMRQDRKIGSGRTQEPRNSRKPTEARNGEFAEQRRPSDDKRPNLPQQNGSTSESKRYTQQRAAARGDASQPAAPIPQAQPAAAQAQSQQAARHPMPAPSRQGHAPQQPLPPQHVPQQQAYYELPPAPAPYFVPQFDGAAGPPQNFIQPNPFINHPTAYIAPPAPAAHPYMMSPEGPVPEVYAPAPGSNGAPGITYYSATQQMYMAHQQHGSQPPRRKAAIPIKPPPEPKHHNVEPKPLET